MFVDWLIHNSFEFIHWLMTFIPADARSSEILTNIAVYIADIYAKGGDIFFLFVPETPFKVAIDILFFWILHEPGWKAILWAVKKIPFLGIE